MVSITVNAVRFLFTFLILVTGSTTFCACKFSLTGHFVVSVLLAPETPERIQNVNINFNSKESYFYRSGKDRESKRDDNGAGIFSASITLNSYLPYFCDTLW